MSRNKSINKIKAEALEAQYLAAEQAKRERETAVIADRSEFTFWLLEWHEYLIQLHAQEYAVNCLEWALWFESAPAAEYNFEYMRWETEGLLVEPYAV